MKTFHYKLGHEAGKTMTVAELRLKLTEYPDDMPVFAEWESVHGYIEPRAFNVERVHKGDEREACDALIIDVNDY